ncbi:MAG: trypsin-like peptidase domain-containing protein [Vicinamibacteria bacterium]|nr:trypsin-like peptidase domain-containing protein [Vicinamibacteria bacterium]
MLRRTAFAVVLVLAGFVAGLVLTGRMRSAGPADAAPVPAPVRPAPVAAAAAEAPPRALAPVGPDFTAIAERTIDTVTNISSMQPPRRRASPFAGDPFFEQFFGDMDSFGGRAQPQYSLGSGVVVSSDGYILTNVHVLGELGRGTEVRVTLSDKRELRAQVIGADPATDIALVKINARNLAAIPWGDSSQLKIAEWVLAIGNPYQLNQTVTLGIVSALGRTNLGIAGYEDFIQTDAAINPGNSGGALINSRGELIGINTAIFTESRGYQGIGFAVPSNLARRVMDDLIAYGEVRRGSIGVVELVPVSAEVARQFELPRAEGLLVARMSRTSSAYLSGLRPGDVVLSFNGTKVDTPAQLWRLVADTPVGTSVKLKVQRADRAVDLTVPVVTASRRLPVSR